MKRNLILLVTLLLCRDFLAAQDLNAYTTSLSGSVSFPFRKTEVPPWIIPGGWRTYFFVDGSNSVVGSSPNDMINNNSIITTAGNVTASAKDGCTAENMFPWRRNYYAIYAAHYFNHPSAGTVNLGILHGENLSVVGSDQPPVSCGGIGWDSYAGFVCGSWVPNNQSTNWGQQYFSNDMGPIIWPSTGYFLPNGQKSSLGVRHPSSIIADDGYLYVFYKDQSHYVVPGRPDFPYEEGRLPGLKVARAPIHDALNPLAYKSFYEDANGIQWNSSLPSGFTKHLVTNFLYVQGPKASDIMGGIGNFDYHRFSVAKVTGTNYYMGLACYQDHDDKWQNGQGQWMAKMKVSLRYSYDLVHWFGNRVIDVTNDWTTTSFNYPVFLSADGWSNTRIDENNFYVLGTAPRPSGIYNTVYRMRVHIPAPPPPPPPPPPPICYDQWGNQILCPSDQCFDEHGQPTWCELPMRKAAPGIAKELDNGKGRSPFVFPNPGPGVFQLRYTLRDPARTQLNVLDLTGRQVQTGAGVNRMPGTYTEMVNIGGYARGVYMLELLVNGRKQTFKVIYQ